MNRLDGWRGRLSAVVDRHRREAFAWGSHDCGVFAADCVEAVTGADPIAQFRGRYDSYRGLIDLLREERCDDAADYLVARFPEISPSRATSGDLVIVDDRGIGALGVCVGSEIAAYGQYGIGFVPFGRGKRAFRVG